MEESDVDVYIVDIYNGKRLKTLRTYQYTFIGRDYQKDDRA